MKIVGDIQLRGDLIVEGVLIGIDTFTLEGNGFGILVQNGGRLDLAGQPKTAWGHWGDPVVGWQVGDRLSVAPTAPDVYDPISAVWQGSWAATARPASSPDITLVDGRTARPEVVNLSQTVRLHNLSRVMFHEGAGTQSLRWLDVSDCGVLGKLGFYPIHFHLVGESARGSLVESVVVENSKFRAFVPHGSHGITFRDCAAVNTLFTPFWWDLTAPDATRDTLFDRCLALGVSISGNSFDGNGIRSAGFWLPQGSGNAIVDSAAVAVRHRHQSSGFHWPETGSGRWVFKRNLAHNNFAFGLFSWGGAPVEVEDFDSYHCGIEGIDHGSYKNNSTYRRVTSSQDGRGQNPFTDHAALNIYAKGDPGALFEGFLTDHQLRLSNSPFLGTNTSIVRGSTFTGVTVAAGITDIFYRFEDCNLSPAGFTLVGLGGGSILEIYEGGTLLHRWSAGAWS